MEKNNKIFYVYYTILIISKGYSIYKQVYYTILIIFKKTLLLLNKCITQKKKKKFKKEKKRCGFWEKNRQFKKKEY